MEEGMSLKDMEDNLPSSSAVLGGLPNFELTVTAPDLTHVSPFDSQASSPVISRRCSVENKGIDKELEKILDNDPELMLSPPYQAANLLQSRSFQGPLNSCHMGYSSDSYHVPSRSCISLPPVVSSVSSPYPANVVEKIKSRNLVNNRPPTFKQINPSSRTHLKQMLYREQIMQQEKARNYPPIASQSKPIKSDKPQRYDIIRNDVPREVYNVSTRLQNPTKSFVLETQRQQVQEYLNYERKNTNKLEDINLGYEDASNNNQPNTGEEFLDDFLSNDTSLEDGAVPDIKGIDSAINMTGNEVNASTLLDFITHFDNSTHNHNNNVEHVATKSMPSRGSGIKSPILEDITVKEEPLTDEDLKAMQKDRQKKDNHNMIERRRRFNINDRIKELGTLLPKQQDQYYDIVRDVRQNKGSILKASVDYIKHLKEDQIKKRQLEDEFKSIKLENRKLILQMQEYEKQFKAYGIPLQTFSWNSPSTNTETPGPTSDSSIGSIKEEPGLISKEFGDLMDDEEDCHPVSNGDPMLSSPHLSPRGLMSNSSPSSSHYSNDDNALSPDSMDLAA